MAIKSFLSWLLKNKFATIKKMDNSDLELQLSIPQEVIGKIYLKNNGEWHKMFVEMYGDVLGK